MFQLQVHNLVFSGGLGGGEGRGKVTAPHREWTCHSDVCCSRPSPLFGYFDLLLSFPFLSFPRFYQVPQVEGGFRKKRGRVQLRGERKIKKMLQKCYKTPQRESLSPRNSTDVQRSVPGKIQGEKYALERLGRRVLNLHPVVRLFRFDLFFFYIFMFPPSIVRACPCLY